MSQSHDLKIIPELFWAVHQGKKTAEIRKNDRDFRYGDKLRLWWFNGEYNGLFIDRKISHIVHGGQYGIEKGYCLLSMVPLDSERPKNDLNFAVNVSCTDKDLPEMCKTQGD